MPTADKRIPVTEETYKVLHRLKSPGQTYDELVQELVQERRRTELEQRFRDLEEKDCDGLTALDGV